MEAESPRRGSWLARALVYGVTLSLAEAGAAFLLGLREPLFFALQSGLLAALGFALAVLPARWAGVLPLIGAGLLHLRNVGFEDSPGGVRLAVASLHVLVLLAAWSRVQRARQLTFLASYTTQALGCAGLLFSLERASHTDWALPIGVLTTLILPVLALACVQLATSPRRAARGPALLVLLALIAAPLLWGQQVAWAAHRRLPATVTQTAVPATDVILIVLDTVRADRMSLYGHARPTTPNLAAFAQTATLYGPAQSAGSWTLPGHASIFTGLYVSEHAADHRPDGGTNRLAPTALTLAERLRASGSSTACIAANADMFVEGFGLTQGFETRWAEAGVTRHLTVPWLASTLAHAVAGQSARKRIGPLERDDFPPATEINRLALQWLERTNPARPRFLFLNYMEAHGQLRREPCAAPIFGDGRPFLENDVPNYDEVMAGRETPSAESVLRIEDWYDSQLACLDQHIGELFEELRARGLFDDALIVVTSDHGQMLGENRSFHHRSEVWEGLVRVPLIIKAPGQATAVRCEGVPETLALFDAVPALLSASVSEAPCPLPPRHDFAVTETRRHARMVELNPARWDRRWLTLRTQASKFALDDAERLHVLAPAEHGETSREASSAEAEAFALLLAEWHAGLRPQATPGLDDPDQEQRASALRRLGYTE